jgi:UDP-N-acetylglucosamine--N-acetylmuramyl-(pentapeptide) pyrophosphoryl-undecaprenol N-acetylglucosamine transferase
VLKALQENDALREKSRISDQSSNEHTLEVLWVGGEGGMEADLLSKEAVEFTTIPAAGVHGVGLSALPGNLWRLFKGFIAARRLIKDFRPQVMFFTGGYLAVPVALAGRWMVSRDIQPRSLLYVPDIEPGLALRTLSRLSAQIALTAEESMEFINFPTKSKVTGYPVRPELKEWSLEDARQAFRLIPDLPTLLVFGGSKGARSINQALIGILPDLLSELQIIHISGHLDWSEVESAKSRLSPDLATRYHAFPYLFEEMGAALTLADLAVSRAGASILGEFPLFGIPAILVPYPYAWRYQAVNARFLEQKGAALVLQDDVLADELLTTIRRLIDDRNLRESMRRAMQALAKPDAAESIADLLYGLVSIPAQEGFNPWSA